MSATSFSTFPGMSYFFASGAPTVSMFLERPVQVICKRETPWNTSKPLRTSLQWFHVQQNVDFCDLVLAHLTRMNEKKNLYTAFTFLMEMEQLFVPRSAREESLLFQTSCITWPDYTGYIAAARTWRAIFDSNTHDCIKKPNRFQTA